MLPQESHRPDSASTQLENCKNTADTPAKRPVFNTASVPLDLPQEPEHSASPPALSVPPAEAERKVENLSQSQLIYRRFCKHKIALVSFLFLVFLYIFAAFAEFFAPHSSQWSNVDSIYAPVQIPKLSLANGLYVEGQQRVIDPMTLKNSYIATGEPTRLGFFVKGEPYKLLGFIPAERHFLGVSADNPPGATFHLLGADKFGRDVFSRLIYGARISLSIGLVSIVVTFILGAVIGGISGYAGGVADNLIQRLIEIINAFPSLPLWLALAAMLPSDWSPLQTYFAITVVLSLLGWTGLARVVRGKILALREEDYAVAARLLGASHGRILFRHLIPGFTSHIIVTLTLGVPAMILGETALSFLGLGLRSPVVSWGVMLQDCMSMDVIANYPWLLMPVILIILTVLAFNFVGDGMRDAADPYSNK